MPQPQLASLLVGQFGNPWWSLGSRLITDNNQSLNRSHIYNEGTIGSYKIYLTTDGGNKNVFSDFGFGYNIKIVLTANEYKIQVPNTGEEIPSSFDNQISVEFKIGSLPIVTKKLTITEYDKEQTFTFFYQPTEFDLLKQDAKLIWIRKISPGIIKIIDSEVVKAGFYYDETLNNTLYDNPNEPYTIPILGGNGLPIRVAIGGNKGENNSIKYGNGRFLSGIWKTGVWNNGWRAINGNGVDDIYYFDTINVSTYQASSNLWLLKIDSNTNFDNYQNIDSNIKVNDYISLGNVVGIDINDERYLLKDYYKVSKIDLNGYVITLTIDIPIAKFPLIRFEIDSQNHLIYVTKNIWLGGTFLNGYFRGVWNYGLFKGFPFTTIMDQSHFVSGKFDGGRFISRITSITSSTSEVREYHTGLIQYFEFYDNNISEIEGVSNNIDNTYQSWVDVNYYTQSYVNLNSLTSIYDDNFGKKVPLPNLYGYPTEDVLSSYSKFKNTTDANIEYYSLGTKYKVYQDFLGQNGYFTKPFNSQANPGLDDFFNSGWVINTGNFYGTPTVSFFYNSNITRRNINRISIILATFGYNVLNNSNISIDDKKYSIVEYDLEYFDRGTFEGQFTNSFSKPLNLLGSNYTSQFNRFESGILKREFFYNKNALDLTLRYNSEFSPIPESLAMFGFNYTHSSPGPGSGETNPSYSTTYSLIMPATSSQYLYTTPAETIPLYEDGQGVEYQKYEIVRRFTQDAFGAYFISLKNNNTADLSDKESWARTTIGYNDVNLDSGVLDKDVAFEFFTSVRINYFKFLEVDALPFFKYFDFEINFFTTYPIESAAGNFLGLEFPKPHGLKKNDKVVIRLDEIRYNPQYEGTASITRTEDGVTLNGDLVYTVRTSIPFGSTVSFLTESGSVTKIGGDRIDRRIQTPYQAVSPKLVGLDENFVYLGNNQILVDRNQF